MIHVKDDKRSKKSASLLVDGLAKCLKDKQIENITISDIQKASGVSRATFYRLFDTVEDILAYKCEELAHDLKTRFMNKDKDPNENFLLFSIKYWIENNAYIEAMYRSNRSDIFQDALIKETETDDFTIGSYTYNQQVESDDITIRLKKEYILSSLIGSLSSILMCWIKNGRKETPEELYSTFFEFGHFMETLKNSK